jgi:hypothetical protein
MLHKASAGGLQVVGGWYSKKELKYAEERCRLDSMILGYNGGKNE